MAKAPRDVDDERAIGELGAEAVGGPVADDEAQVGAEHRAHGDGYILHASPVLRPRAAQGGGVGLFGARECHGDARRLWVQGARHCGACGARR